MGAVMSMPRGDLIVFDADCIFCSRFARFVSRHDRAGRFRFVSAGSATGRALYLQCGLNPNDWTSNIVMINGRALTKLAGFAAVMRAIGGPWRLLAVAGLIPHGPGNWIYDRIARNRYAFGKRRCPMPSADLRGRLID